MSDEDGTMTEGAGKPVESAAKRAGFSLPGLIGKLGLYATYVTAAVLLLVLAGDASVALLGPTPSFWLALLLGTGPLVALLLSTFASYVNYYGSWRILRRKDEYDARQDLKSHAADIPEALQGLLARRNGCAPLVSSLALVLSLALTALTLVPPSLPYVGVVSTYTQQLDSLSGVTHGTPVPGRDATPLPTATPSPTPTPSPTATPCPKLQAQITSPKDGSIYNDRQSIPFAGTITGTCGPIPLSDLAWVALDRQANTYVQMGNGDQVDYTLPAGSYIIYFKVSDPTSGQSSSPSISLTVQPFIG
jgi:hypothetical protein